MKEAAFGTRGRGGFYLEREAVCGRTWKCGLGAHLGVEGSKGGGVEAESRGQESPERLGRKAEEFGLDAEGSGEP